MAHGAELLRSMWDLPGLGIEPVSPVLVGKFLTTGLLGNSRIHPFKVYNSVSFSAFATLCNYQQIFLTPSKETLYPWAVTPVLPTSPASDNHQPILCFDEFSCLDSTYIMSEVIQYFSDLFPLNIMPSGSNHAITNGRVCFFYG